MSEKYQGWTNAQTWCAALTIDNDRNLQRQALIIAERLRKNSKERERYRQQLIDLCWENAKHIRNMAPWAWDSGQVFLKDINWSELLEHYQTKEREINL